VKFVVCLVLLVLACGCLCCSRSSDGSESVSSVVESSFDVGVDSVVSSTVPLVEGDGVVNFSDVFDLVDSGLPYHCTYSSRNQFLELWVLGHGYHGVLSSHKPPYTHIVCDGEWVYIWVEGRSRGVRYVLTGSKGLTGEVEGGSISSGEEFTVNIDIIRAVAGGVDVSCEVADFETNKFTPPRSIQFDVVGSHIVFQE